MAAKKIIIDWSETGKTVYAIIRREADSYLMNDADGTFGAAPADPYLSLAEDATIKGRYEASEGRTVWTDGRYTFAVYKQAGGSPAPASDTIIGTGEMKVESDAEVTEITLSEMLAGGVAKEGSITRLLGLSLDNRVEDDITRDLGNRMTGSVLYCYDSAANAAEHDKSTGLLYRYQTSFTYDAAGLMTIDRITRL